MGSSSSFKIFRTPDSYFFSRAVIKKAIYVGSIMWKLFSWRFQKCYRFLCSDVLNRTRVHKFWVCRCLCCRCICCHCFRCCCHRCLRCLRCRCRWLPHLLFYYLFRLYLYPSLVWTREEWCKFYDGRAGLPLSSSISLPWRPTSPTLPPPLFSPGPRQFASWSSPQQPRLGNIRHGWRGSPAWRWDSRSWEGNGGWATIWPGGQHCCLATSKGVPMPMRGKAAGHEASLSIPLLILPTLDKPTRLNK